MEEAAFQMFSNWEVAQPMRNFSAASLNPTSSSNTLHSSEMKGDGSCRTPAPASTAPAAAPAAAVGTPAAAAGGDSILMGSQLETTINGVCHVPIALC